MADVNEDLRSALDKFAEACRQAGNVLSAQGAMGWAYRGDLEQARRAVAGMGPDAVRALSVAAAALAGIADEELGGRREPRATSPTVVHTIGTDETCSWRIDDDPYVSGRHATVTCETKPDGRVWVADLGSTNGTWVQHGDGPKVRVTAPVEVTLPVTVWVGRTSIRVMRKEEAVERVPGPGPR